MLPAIVFVFDRKQVESLFRTVVETDDQTFAVLPEKLPQLQEAIEQYKASEDPTQLQVHMPFIEGLSSGIGIHHSGLCTFTSLSVTQCVSLRLV